ncbi:MAG: carbohydrate-binding family 9-like protein, partial [Anaerohalosphaera sp.]|nr:carbohydrate-binding family 9-like protein [Anaerohalosphaera sp.]
YLGEFHKDWMYHEEPGKGHWWNLSDEPGADCVDWRPMFDFFARHRLVSDKEIRKVKFTTCNPSVNSKSHWIEIYDQQKSLEFSTADILADPHKRRFTGTTDNIRVLVLDSSVLQGEGQVTVDLDGQKFENIDAPQDGKLWFELSDKKWTVSKQPSKKMKGPHRFGPFKAGFDNNMMFVYGTKGSDQENSWAFAKARFDAEQWWYQGNGSVDVIADSEFTLKGTKDRGVVLYGNRRTNSAWNKLLKKSPIQVGRGKVVIGKRQVVGKNLSCLFVRPRPDSDIASVAVVSGTGIGGMTLTNNLQYLFAGCHYPDFIVIGPEMNEKGADGVLAAGYFGSDWLLNTGDYVWKDRETGEDTASNLPAYIGPDPREFVMPRRYVCMKTTDKIEVDGKLDEESWSKAVWSEPHVDIQGSKRPVTPRFETRFKMVWDEQNLYVAAKLSEPHVWGTITERNAVIFNDNDFEVFIDPDGDCHSYYEFEMNALNTVWNLFMNKPYKHGGNAVIREMDGQNTGVFVKGTLNDPSDEDEYWTVEIAFPFKGMAEHA